MNRDQTLPATCERTATALAATLAQYGYRSERSFDLRTALPDDCPCPHHGTDQCTCQYAVLLVYEEATPTVPARATAHECDGITHWHVEAGQPGGRLAPKLVAALEEAINLMLIDV